MANIKVTVNSEMCIGCGACIAICDSIFALWEDWKSYVVKQPETEEEIKCVDEAVNVCPVGAIKKIVEDETLVKAA